VGEVGRRGRARGRVPGAHRRRNLALTRRTLAQGTRAGLLCGTIHLVSVGRLVRTFEQYGAPVFRVTAPAPVRRHGAVGHSSEHLELYFIAGKRKEWVRADTRLGEQRREFLISNLVGNAALALPLRFPLDLTVTRAPVLLSVDGEDVQFTAYVCGRLAVAVGEIDGRWLYVHTPKRLLPRLTLAREKPGDLRRFLARMDKRLEPHYRATEANIRKRLKAPLSE
jgi:hypothetical protein